MLRDSAHQTPVEADPSGRRLGERTPLSTMRACKACISRTLNEGLEKYSQACSLLSICFIKLFGFWIHVSNKISFSIRMANHSWVQCQEGSWTHDSSRGWELWPYLEALNLRKPQESAISPPPTPALAGFLTLSLSHLGGLRARWEAAGQTHLNLGISFTFTSRAFEMLSLIFMDLPHPW